jgi:phosphoribosylformimino-5-aminoimidazole carboxamide ribotide isomerase
VPVPGGPAAPQPAALEPVAPWPTALEPVAPRFASLARATAQVGRTPGTRRRSFTIASRIATPAAKSPRSGSCKPPALTNSYTKIRVMPVPPSLQVVPVLDLLHGQVVRAVRGERSAYRPIRSPLVHGSEPRDVARALLARCAAALGRATVLYAADLDAIQGRPPQLAALADLLALQPDLALWLDAGFAGPPAARALRGALGATGARVRPVYGSESLATAAALDAVAADPDAILSLDCRLARPLDPSGSWRRPQAWPRTVVVMTLDRVGSGRGPDLDTFARLRAMAPDRTWFGAGGLRDASDLEGAAAVGAAGWLVASALHDGGSGSG